MTKNTTVKELREQLALKGIKAPSKATKSDLESLLATTVEKPVVKKNPELKKSFSGEY